jgi:sugar/nucleoside kinase (ribokinase family)
VALVAAVGDDLLADVARRMLDDAGVRWAGVTVADAPTGACVVLVDEDGERTMLPQRGANDRLAEPEVVDALVAIGPSWVHLSGYALVHEGSRPAGLAALRQARAAAATVSVDVASAAPIVAAGPAAVLGWIEEVDVVFANEDELDALGGEEEILARARCVVAKHGAGGARWSDGRRSGSGAAHRAEVIDTTGAGDAFAAGWIAAALAGSGPADALQAALATGARAVERLGARPASLRGDR